MLGAIGGHPARLPRIGLAGHSGQLGYVKAKETELAEAKRTALERYNTTLAKPKPRPRPKPTA